MDEQFELFPVRLTQLISQPIAQPNAEKCSIILIGHLRAEIEQTKLTTHQIAVASRPGR